MIMKKKRHIPVLGIDKLYEMHTGSLLSRLQALRECNETKNEGDDGICYKDITSKDQEEWKIAYRQIKEVLSGREHYEKKTRRMR
jgi:hypothetical protein